MNIMRYRALIFTAIAIAAAKGCSGRKEPVDYVNPYIGNISHLLVPTFPTVQLPNSLMRVYPERADYTSEYLNGLPVIVTNHRERSAFKFSVTRDESIAPVIPVNYDNEHITPYSFSVDLADNTIRVEYAVSHQSAIYRLTFREDGQAKVILSSANGEIKAEGPVLDGVQHLDDITSVYVHMEFKEQPAGISYPEGSTGYAVLTFDQNELHVRYGISLISCEQAAANLHREIKDYDIEAVAREGRRIWNEALGRISVESDDEDRLSVFYTSYYRTFERPVCLSEDGRYWSAYDGAVHNDEGTPFYTDDWCWDTYRAAHPLRIIMDRNIEEDILASYLRMAEQMGTGWLPTFPEITGDSRRMNSNHSVAMFADALAKGLEIDVEKAYSASKGALTGKTLCPWCGNAAGWIDGFFWKNGYMPALREGEQESDPNVHPFEKRQPVAVSLGTYYDCWCLSALAKAAGHTDDAEYFMEKSSGYHKLFNSNTLFFHPKGKDGKWIENLDYNFPGGMGAREYYDENNAWVYRWDVQHNIPDLIELMGGNENFVRELDRMFATGLGRSKFEFFAKLPDHTGNIGQFSMANEPSLHIPYLYNYAGAPWKTQKRIRQMLDTWFRNDLMGVPGDEDGGGLTSFVVFSSLGFYPVTPGSDLYAIGSPVFKRSTIQLENGNTFEIEAVNVSADNKYIQSAKLDGKDLDIAFIRHKDLMDGGKLVLEMGNTPAVKWGMKK